MPRMSSRSALLAVLAAAAAVLCAAPAAQARTKWLCRPGLADNPCTPGLATTRFSPTGMALGVTRPHARQPVDCFYVYPTVSDQPGISATRAIDPEERSIARFQAARYSQHCRVFAPLYRQLTLAGIMRPFAEQKAAALTAYGDVLAAWRDYLAHFNHGRGVVLIGHSQGTGHLTRLLHTEIERHASQRRRLVSAILLGGNVAVRKGRGIGGSFDKVPACRSRTQTGCVIAFSTFDATPPADSIFGRLHGRFSSVLGGPSGKRFRVLCTNPAALRGGSARLTPVFPTVPFAPGTIIAAATAATGVSVPSASTPWASVPGAYTAHCSNGGGATVLRIVPRDGAPVPLPVPDATWGLHLLDANIALGDLVDVVGAQARRWVARH
jgi:hypothetical protein